MSGLHHCFSRDPDPMSAADREKSLADLPLVGIEGMSCKDFHESSHQLGIRHAPILDS